MRAHYPDLFSWRWLRGRSLLLLGESCNIPIFRNIIIVYILIIGYTYYIEKRVNNNNNINYLLVKRLEMKRLKSIGVESVNYGLKMWTTFVEGLVMPLGNLSWEVLLMEGPFMPNKIEFWVGTVNIKDEGLIGSFRNLQC